MPERITAWSYSRATCYEECAFKAKCRYIMKLKEPKGKALVNGSAIHEKAEHYLNGVTSRLPKELKKFNDEYPKSFQFLKAQKPVVEIQWAFTNDWQPCEWFDKKAWCRMILDAAAIGAVKPNLARVIDHKTGQFRETNRPQLGLQALGTFIMYPEIEKVSSEFWYLDVPMKDPEEFNRKDVAGLKKYWEKRTRKMLADTTFKPNPSAPYCGSCHFKKNKGGPCKF